MRIDVRRPEQLGVRGRPPVRRSKTRSLTHGHFHVYAVSGPDCFGRDRSFELTTTTPEFRSRRTGLARAPLLWSSAVPSRAEGCQRRQHVGNDVCMDRPHAELGALLNADPQMLLPDGVRCRRRSASRDRKRIRQPSDDRRHNSMLLQLVRYRALADVGMTSVMPRIGRCRGTAGGPAHGGDRGDTLPPSGSPTIRVVEIATRVSLSTATAKTDVNRAMTSSAPRTALGSARVGTLLATPALSCRPRRRWRVSRFPGASSTGIQLPWKPKGTRNGRWTVANGAGGVVLGGENDEVAGVGLRSVDRGEHPAVVLGGVVAGRYEDPFPCLGAVGEPGFGDGAAGEVVTQQGAELAGGLVLGDCRGVGEPVVGSPSVAGRAAGELLGPISSRIS